jgi:hypothetical protein
MVDGSEPLSMVEPGIILHRETGRVTAAVYRQAVLDRIRFADQHQLTRYVLVADLQAAQSDLGTFSLALSQWSIEADPRLLHTVVIGQQGLIRVGLKLLQAVMQPRQMRVELCDDLPSALERARAVLHSAPGSAS